MPSVRHYCTYFDSVYAARGLVMIASLLERTPDARVYVLCLDDLAWRIVTECMPAARPVRLAELEAFDPELAACRANRSAIEYYFTCTPCLPRYVLVQEQSAGMVTYLDADLFFFQSPERVFDEIGDASVAITPHRFSPGLSDRVRFGRFNVAWVSWRNDAEGRRCLEDYRADCLDWCYDRAEENRFADQKYLDAWPERYQSVRILDHKGINLALWNVDGSQISRDGDRFLVDKYPLIFFHFHSVKHLSPGSYDIRFREYGVQRNQPILVEGIYKPYLARIDRTFNELAARYGLPIPGDQRYGKDRGKPLELATSSPVGATAPIPGSYRVIDGVSAADQDDAWEHPDVVQQYDGACNELLNAMHRGQPRADLVVAASAVVATGLERPSLLDVGCARGLHSEVFRQLLGGRVDYTGADLSPALIELARQRHPERRFEVTDLTRMPFADACFDIAFSGMMPIRTLNYEAVIAESRRVARRFVILHSVPLLQHRRTTFLRKLIHGRPTVEVILGEGELRLALARHGLAVRRVWESIPYDLAAVLGDAVLTRTFLCEVVQPVSTERPALLNVGCGSHFHTDWCNVDIAPRSPAVLAHNITAEPLPFQDGTFDAVYHSHVLEHLPRVAAPAFIAECHRLLKPGGVLRIAVPDLEPIARLYLETLARAAAGDQDAAERYDWLLLELFDQMVRNESGGDMPRFLHRMQPATENFVLERVGSEARAIITQVRAHPPSPASASLPTPEAIGRFRLSGEVHQWMYDRFSLGRMLDKGGFVDIRVVTAIASAIPHFAAYGLDTEPDGRVRKPDSLFMEARKPLG